MPKRKIDPKHLKHDINENPYFVMLHLENAHGCLVAMCLEGNDPEDPDDDSIATFKTYEEAEAAGRENNLGAHFGFEVFKHGEGCLG